MRLTNEARLATGLAPLEADEALARAARQHAGEMAELGYISHTSPLPENATLEQRTAQTGSFALALGENLARVSPEDAAGATVTGWLESPGHRANLLNPDFTHVGFGSAAYEDGSLAVAQVFAAQPTTIEEADLVSVLTETPTLDVTLDLEQAAEVAVFFGERSSRSVELSSGEQILHVPLQERPTLPLSVQLGARSAGAGFILQDSGWLYADGWRGEPAIAQRQGQLLEVELNAPLARQYEVRLRFSSDPGPDLVAWQGENLVPTEGSGTYLTIALPEPENTLPLYLGLPEGGGNYRAIYGFLPQIGALELVPAGPRD